MESRFSNLDFSPYDSVILSTEAKVRGDASRVAVGAGAGGLAADADVAWRHAGVMRLHSVEGVLKYDAGSASILTRFQLGISYLVT